MNFYDEYKNSNSQQQLEMYLQYPELRSEFDNIEKTAYDKESIDSQQVFIVPEKIQNKQTLLVRIKNGCFSLFA